MSTPCYRNYKSDFSLKETFYTYEDGERIEADIPPVGVDFEIVYFTNDKQRYVAGRKGNAYFNCREYNNATLLVWLPLSTHPLGIGVLHHELYIHAPQADSPNGIQNICIPKDTGYFLHKGQSEGDVPTGSSLPGFDPIIVAGQSAYHLAQSLGYEGTEKEYALGSLSTPTIFKSDYVVDTATCAPYLPVWLSRNQTVLCRNEIGYSVYAAVKITYENGYKYTRLFGPQIDASPDPTECKFLYHTRDWDFDWSQPIYRLGEEVEGNQYDDIVIKPNKNERIVVLYRQLDNPLPAGVYRSLGNGRFEKLPLRTNNPIKVKGCTDEYVLFDGHYKRLHTLDLCEKYKASTIDKLFPLFSTSDMTDEQFIRQLLGMDDNAVCNLTIMVRKPSKKCRYARCWRNGNQVNVDWPRHTMTYTPLGYDGEKGRLFTNLLKVAEGHGPEGLSLKNKLMSHHIGGDHVVDFVDISISTKKHPRSKNVKKIFVRLTQCANYGWRATQQA